MRHQRQADQAAREREQELEIAGGCPIGERHFEAVVAPRALDPMRWGIGITEARGAVDFQAEAARGVLTIAIAQIPEAPRITGTVQQLRVLQRDFASFPRRDRENAGANQSLSRQLDE